MHLLLERTPYTESRYYRDLPIMDGALYIGGLKVCDTSESTLNLLADGTYDIAICHCHQRQRQLPIVILANGEKLPCERCTPIPDASVSTNMPVTCRQIIPANGVAWRTDGRIIVGRRLVPGCLVNTRQTFDQIYERLRKSVQRGHRITITIKTLT